MNLTPGTKLRSAVCATEVIVVRAPAAAVDLRCGGTPMLADGDERPQAGAPGAAHGAGTQLGKRYADDETGMEVLCTKAGEGSLSLGDQPLLLQAAKALPSSD